VEMEREDDQADGSGNGEGNLRFRLEERVWKFCFSREYNSQVGTL